MRRLRRGSSCSPCRSAAARALRLPHEADVVRARALPAPLQRDRARAGAREGPRPGARRGGDLPGVEVPTPTRARASGAVGLMQLQPETAQGIALRTGGTAFRVSDLYEPRDQHPLRRVVPAEPVREVRQRAARARRVQRGPGQRRPLARERPGDRVRRDARVRRRGRAPEAHLPRGLARRAVPAAAESLDPVLELAENANTYTPLGPTRRARSSPTATCSGWAAPTTRPGTSRSASASARTSSTRCAPRSTRALRARGRTGCTWEVGSSRDAARPRRPAARARPRRRRRPVRGRDGADRAAARRRRRRTSRCGG